jgi:hypothetical protein
MGRGAWGVAHGAWGVAHGAVAKFQPAVGDIPVRQVDFFDFRKKAYIQNLSKAGYL